jgi:polyhydroxyalkanoate synthase
VLAGSGHIAGVINPPYKTKYMHWTYDGLDNQLPSSLEDWLKKAQEHAGSWWPDYGKWLSVYSGEKVPARQPGTGPFPAIEDAPGSYVKL